MNKRFTLFALAASSFFSTHAYVATPAEFTKLAPKIINQATTWVKTLNDDAMLVYLNLFALDSQESVNAGMKCAQFIGDNEELIENAQAFRLGVMNIMQTYIEPIQKKIDAQLNLTEQEEESIYQKLEMKIRDLFEYIHAVYYEALYNHASEQGTKNLTFMFDSEGIIAPEQRTKALPSSL
jgi:hypothetical protein